MIRDGSTGTYGYDVLGRATTIPGLDAASSGTRSIAYFDNDLPRTVVDTFLRGCHPVMPRPPREAA
ncbi:hypothetical protein QT381_13480 [Galbitalea sp. SE-J8]|uniref:hypothetical protein n=1 Tax=Galbitalea sp. SE-J8 TaxID=3054952 RepID=UPI00259D0025|nr:hypothetical protein [Galbitalea sp. SE-J8]MDM4764021.1 hypothetical protein [Galbitalea sp. SE-J8]